MYLECNVLKTIEDKTKYYEILKLNNNKRSMYQTP